MVAQRRQKWPQVGAANFQLRVWEFRLRVQGLAILGIGAWADKHEVQGLGFRLTTCTTSSEEPCKDARTPTQSLGQPSNPELDLVTLDGRAPLACGLVMNSDLTHGNVAESWV